MQYTKKQREILKRARSQVREFAKNAKSLERELEDGDYFEDYHGALHYLQDLGSRLEGTYKAWEAACEPE